MTPLLRAVELVTHLEIFALLISAICHDFEHPGLNNTFLANTSNSLALRYNDRSILENHHCARYQEHPHHHHHHHVRNRRLTLVAYVRAGPSC